GEDRSPEGMKTFIAGLNARIDSMAVEVLELFADGPMVAAQSAIRGTRVATGAPISLTEMQLYRIDAGRIAERWYAVNRAGLPQPPSSLAKAK
ncbi:MAG TPA: ester cyclase, partial [Chloroflexota bacterium]|nr:ester cyclase [Chloroflexota bacterium]